MFFFKKQVKDNKLNDHIQLLQKLKTDIRHLRELYGYLNSSLLSKNLKQICQIADKILKEVSIHQEKLTKISMFIDYYLPTTIKLLEQYLDIKNNHLTSNENKQMMITIEETMTKIKTAFDELLNQLFEDDNKEADVEIRVLMNELKKWMK